MKLLVVLAAFTGAYLYLLLHTTNVVMTQTQQMNSMYQYVANNADSIAAGK